MYLCDAGLMTDRNFRYDLELRYASRVRYPCTFFNVPLSIFINEIQGKAFVIHLSFGDRNRFYIDCFSILNVRQICICLGPWGHRVI